MVSEGHSVRQMALYEHGDGKEESGAWGRAARK